MEDTIPLPFRSRLVDNAAHEYLLVVTYDLSQHPTAILIPCISITLGTMNH